MECPSHLVIGGTLGLKLLLETWRRRRGTPNTMLVFTGRRPHLPVSEDRSQPLSKPRFCEDATDFLPRSRLGVNSSPPAAGLDLEFNSELADVVTSWCERAPVSGCPERVLADRHAHADIGMAVV